MVAHGFPMSDSSDDSADTVISVLESRLLLQDLTDPDSPLDSSDSEGKPESDEMGNRQGGEKKKKRDEPQEKKAEDKPKKKGKKSKGKSKRSSQNIESDFASTEGASASLSGTERPRHKSKRPDVLADLGQHSPGSPLGSPGSACGSQGTWSPDDESDVSTLGYSTPLLSTPQVQRYVLPKQSTPQQSSSERLEELGRSIEKTIIDKLSDKTQGEGAAAPAVSGVSAPGPERKGKRNVKKKRALGQAVIDSDSFTLPLEDAKGGQTSTPSPTSKRLNVGTEKISLRASQESPVSPWLRDDDTPVDEEQMDEMFISCIDLSYNLADICSEKEFTEYGSLDSKKQARSQRERSKDTSLSPRIARKPIVPMTPPLVPILPVLKPVDSRETPPKSDSSTSTLAEIGRDPASDAMQIDVPDSSIACDASTSVSQDAAQKESKEKAPIASQDTSLQECQPVHENTVVTPNGAKDAGKQQQTKRKQGKSKSKGKKKRNSKSYDDKESDIPAETKTEEVCSEVSTSSANNDSNVCVNTRLEVSDDVREPVSDYDNGPPTVYKQEYRTDSVTSDREHLSDISDIASRDKSALTVKDSHDTKQNTEIVQDLSTNQLHETLVSVKVDTSLETDTILTSEAAIDTNVHHLIDTAESDSEDRIKDPYTLIPTVTARAEVISSSNVSTTTDEKPKFTETSEDTVSTITADVTTKTNDTPLKPNNMEKEDDRPTPLTNVEENTEDLSAAKPDITGKESSSNLSPNEPASPKHVPPPSPLAMDALAEIDEDDEEAIEALEENSQMKEVQLFGETVFKRLSSLVESQSQDEDLEERHNDFHEDVDTDSPPVDLGSMTLLSESFENESTKINEERCIESESAKEVVEEMVVPGSVVRVEKSVTNISDSTDVLQLSNNDGTIEHGKVDDKEDVDDGTLKRKKKKTSQKKSKKDKTKKGNVVKKPEIPAELKQAGRTEGKSLSHSEDKIESKTEDESEKVNAPPKRESQQIEEVIDAYGIVDLDEEKPFKEGLVIDIEPPRFESDSSDVDEDDDDSESSFNTKSRSSELPSSSSIELTPRGIPEIEETFSELLSVKHILEDLEDRTPTEEVLPSFAGYDELRSPPEHVNGRRSRMSPAVTDRTESDLDISEQRDDISTDSMYADDEDDGASEVLFSRSYSEPAGNEVVVSCTFYNTQHNNNTNMDDSDDFWEDYTTADESFKQIEISADAASSTFQNARKQMHDIHQHLQDLRRQMEHLQEEVESATLTPEYSMDSEDKRPITE